MMNCTRYLAVAALLGASGTASAQAVNLSGSDTLELVVKDAISAAQTAPNGAGGVLLTPGLLNYVGGGSGTAETANTVGTQAIAPMSRNYGLAVLQAHPLWQPTPANVVALDAAVIATRNYPSRVKNFPAPNAFAAAELTNKAVPNIFTGAAGACNCPAPGAGSCSGCTYTPGTSNSGYSQLIEVILSGIDGSGTYAACADPRRAQAISDFATLHGVTTVEHFYRRDDNSGTTNVFQDKMAVGRFCNGRARGVLGTNATDPANPNLNNQDLDPVRRICPNPGTVPGTATARKRTTCSNLGTGAICQFSDNAVGCTIDGAGGTPVCVCTQGLVVALSIGDDTASLVDVTTTIGSRAAADLGNTTFGYAGREATTVTGATAPFVDGASYADQNVRNDGYLLSRRLYINFAADVVGAPQFAAQQTLFNFMTDPSGASNADGSQGPCNMDAPGVDAAGKPNSIVRKHGFIPCTADCAASRTGTLCGKTTTVPGVPPPTAGTFPAALSTLANCFPNGTGAANTIWSFGATTGAGTTTCCSSNAAPTAGACPAAVPAARWPVGSLMTCTTAAECASGSCLDNLGTGVLQCQ